jgi:hypothetical protein
MTSARRAAAPRHFVERLSRVLKYSQFTIVV